MACAVRSGSLALTAALEDLLGRAYEYGFYEALSVLERGLGTEIGRDPTNERAPRVRLRPHDGDGFASGDVRSVTIGADAKEAEVTINFFGLYGPASPLPPWFTRPVLQEHGRHRPHQRFLDLFNQRLFELYYLCLKRHRLGACQLSSSDDTAVERLLCLVGRTDSKGAFPGGLGMALQLAPVLRRRVPNACGLALTIQAAFPGVPVEIRENALREVRVSVRPRLGCLQRPARLGVTALLGSRVADRSGRFRVVLGPLTWGQRISFAKGGDAAASLRRVVEAYVPPALDFEVELVVDSKQFPPTRIGRGIRGLGRSTWVGKPRSGLVRQVVHYTENAA